MSHESDFLAGLYAKYDAINLVSKPEHYHNRLQREGVDEAINEMKEPFAVVDTADGNKVVGTASDEKGAKSIITSAELPPMKIKDKKTLKIMKSKKKQMIGQPFKEEVELDEGKVKDMLMDLEDDATTMSKADFVAKHGEDKANEKLTQKRNEITADILFKDIIRDGVNKKNKIRPITSWFKPV